MLTIKHKPNISFPAIASLSGPMRFSPATNDSDELLTDLDTQFADQDDQWTLTERPDSEQLEHFWDEVVADVRKDPDWITIDE